METAQTILVIFLSSALAIFLVLGIMLLIVCVKIAKTVQRITAKAELLVEKAEHLADKAESVAEFMQRAATPMSIGRAITQVVEKAFMRSQTAHKKKEEER